MLSRLRILASAARTQNPRGDPAVLARVSTSISLSHLELERHRARARARAQTDMSDLVAALTLTALFRVLRVDKEGNSEG